MYLRLKPSAGLLKLLYAQELVQQNPAHGSIITPVDPFSLKSTAMQVWYGILEFNVPLDTV